MNLLQHRFVPKIIRLFKYLRLLRKFGTSPFVLVGGGGTDSKERDCPRIIITSQTATKFVTRYARGGSRSLKNSIDHQNRVPLITQVASCYVHNLDFVFLSLRPHIILERYGL